VQPLAPTPRSSVIPIDTGEAGASYAELVAHTVHDPRAFALLYRRYLDPIYRYCLHRLGSTEVAEDATSQIFLKALGALSTYAAERPFRSWLFAIAHNVVVDHYRAQREEQPLEAALEVLDSARSPEELAVVGDEVRAVRSLLATLTPEQAHVIELRLAGLTEVEIANALGRRPGAVRAAQFRALGRLRALLGVPSRTRGDADA
jgi:RNA polymerase sigma-70 factor (ECF subfamily)